MGLKQLSTLENSQGIELKRANAQHPLSKAFILAQVTPDEDIIVSMAEKEFTREMYVFDTENEIPSHFPSEVKNQILMWLKENKFEDRDNDVCIISPFIPNLRGFIAEIFDRDYAEKYSHEIARNSGIKVKGLFSVIDDTFIDEQDLVSLNDSSLNQKIQELKYKEEDENRQAVEKAKNINKRLW